MAEQFPSGRALVIGIANYPTVNKLPEAVLNDAREMENLLTSTAYCGYPAEQVKLLLDGEANANSIRRELQNLSQNANQNDTVIIFFSGHGGRKATGEDAGTYLIPYDCDPNRLKDTAIESGELTKLLSGIKSQRLVLLLDACHAAGAGNPKDAIEPVVGIKAGLGADVYNVLGSGIGRVVMASSREDESSHVISGDNHSVFTKHLLDALKGKAALPGENLVRVFPVFRYVSDAVPAEQADQHPNFKANGLENDFAIALNQGGKKAISEVAQKRARPELLNPKVEYELIDGLIDRWERLAVYFAVPANDRRKLERADDPPLKLLDWIKSRKRIDELRDAFNFCGWDDLIETLDRYTTPPATDSHKESYPLFGTTVVVVAAGAAAAGLGLPSFPPWNASEQVEPAQGNQKSMEQQDNARGPITAKEFKQLATEFYELCKVISKQQHTEFKKSDERARFREFHPRFLDSLRAYRAQLPVNIERSYIEDMESAYKLLIASDGRLAAEEHMFSSGAQGDGGGQIGRHENFLMYLKSYIEASNRWGIDFSTGIQD